MVRSQKLKCHAVADVSHRKLEKQRAIEKKATGDNSQLHTQISLPP